MQQVFKELQERVDAGDDDPLLENILGRKQDFDKTKRQVRELNEDLRETRMVLRGIGDEERKEGGIGKLVKGFGVTGIAAGTVRTVMAVPKMIGEQYGPLGAGAMSLVSGATNTALGGTIGTAGLLSGNLPLAIGGGLMAAAGGVEMAQALGSTISGVIQKAFSGVSVFQDLEIGRQASRQLFNNQNIDFRSLTDIGVTQQQMMALMQSLGTATNDVDPRLLATLAGYGKAEGIGPEGGLMLAELTKYSGSQFGEDFLGRFNKMAERLEMDSGRRMELQQSIVQLSSEFYRRAGITDVNMPLIARDVVARIFGEDSEMAKSGAADFAGRLQQGIANPGSDAARFMMLQAAGFGQDGKGLFEAQMAMEKGLADPKLFSNLQKMFVENFGNATKDVQAFALQGLFPALQAWEIDKLRTSFLSGEDFQTFRETVEKDDPAGKSALAKGVAGTSEIERHRVRMMNLMDDVGSRLNSSVMYMEKITAELSVKVGGQIADSLERISTEGFTLTEAFGTLYAVVQNVAGELGRVLGGPDEMESYQQFTPQEMVDTRAEAGAMSGVGHANIPSPMELTEKRFDASLQQTKFRGISLDNVDPSQISQLRRSGRSNEAEKSSAVLSAQAAEDFEKRLKRLQSEGLPDQPKPPRESDRPIEVVRDVGRLIQPPQAKFDIPERSNQQKVKRRSPVPTEEIDMMRNLPRTNVNQVPLPKIEITLPKSNRDDRQAVKKPESPSIPQFGAAASPEIDHSPVPPASPTPRIEVNLPRSNRDEGQISKGPESPQVPQFGVSFAPEVEQRQAPQFGSSFAPEVEQKPIRAARSRMLDLPQDIKIPKVEQQQTINPVVNMNLQINVPAGQQGRGMITNKAKVADALRGMDRKIAEEVTKRLQLNPE